MAAYGPSMTVRSGAGAENGISESLLSDGHSTTQATKPDDLDAKKSDVFNVMNTMELEKDRRVAIDVINWELSRVLAMDSRQTILIDSNSRRPNRLMATKLMDEELDLMMQLEEHCRKGAIHRLYVQIKSGVQMWLLADQTFQWPGDRISQTQ
ncbi:hypothetical protein C8J56DRAFT_891791 [Mycena floridula]|nr:hypothetical protein C8J56DRAFT_891791 [Mycena floridula]